MEDLSELKKEITVEETKNVFRYIPGLIVALGYFLFFCLSFIFCFELFYTDSAPHNSSQNTFATSLPPTTPTPHIPALIDLTALKIVGDDFTNDQNRWVSDYDSTKLTVRNGKLPLQSKTTDNYLIAICQACPSMYSPYYIEADFSTDKATDESFGLVIDKKPAGFYLFEVNIESKKYYIYQKTIDDWSLRGAGESDKIRAFPNANTLGVYVSKDSLELYINGTLVDLYTETGHSFYYYAFGIYVNNSGFELSVDNLVVRKTRK